MTDSQNIFDRARILIKDNNLDQWIVASNEGCDIHSKFLLNVASHARSYVIINKQPPDYVIATAMETAMMKSSLQQQGINAQFLSFDNIIQIPDMLKSVLKGKRIGANFGENLFDQHGTEFADYIRAGDLQSIRQIAPQADFLSAAPIIYGLRARKSLAEQKDMANVVKATEEILERLPDWVSIGMSEREVKAKLEFEYNKVGTPSFDTIVGMGPNGANPHHNTDKSSSKIAKGPLLIDTGLRIDRMCSDLTWTYWVGGTPDPEFIRAYDVLMQAKKASFTALKAGESINQPDIKCREVLEKNGYEHVKLYNHGLGHSLGYEVHDIGPRMNWKMDPSIKLEEGMIYSNEPGLYWVGKWGIRLEDDLVITEEGYQLFSTLPNDPLTI
jgi:Xaa-Pro aminopeptidase